jgi:GNAT superfamily N-acetyltransferase
MSIAIRAARLDDAAAIAVLTVQLGYEATTHEVAARLERLLADDESAVLVAPDHDDEPLGWLHVYLHRSIESSRTARIGGLVVDESQRSLGIGLALLEAAEAWAREHEVTRTTLYSRQSREQAHRFYERSGYRIVKHSYQLEKDLAR